jgi:hypothetical protein
MTFLSNPLGRKKIFRPKTWLPEKPFWFAPKAGEPKPQLERRKMGILAFLALQRTKAEV